MARFSLGPLGDSLFSRAPSEASVPVAEVVETSLVPHAGASWGGAGQLLVNHDGDKWAGSFGATEILSTDYWTLRARSWQLFEQNLFARGLIRRLITNEINTGLHLESSPMASLLGKTDDELEVWSEDVENRFELWAKTPELCDHLEMQTFGQLQQDIRREALVSGDVLIVLHQDQRTGLPRVRVVSGWLVRSPIAGAKLAPGYKIVHGVEMDPQGRHVAYWVDQEDGQSRRIPAWGEKSGRRLAWMVYGCERMREETRGKPLLSIMLQSLRDLDRYRDAAIRKAVVNSILAMFVEKKEQLPSAMPITSGGAVKKGTITDTSPTGGKRTWNVAQSLPGLFIEELQAGETIKPGTQGGTDAQLGEFQDAVLAAIAMASEMPPELLQLKFSSNYSASRAALNEADAYVFKARTMFGEQCPTPIFQEWFVSSVINGSIRADGFLEAWRDYRQQATAQAWMFCDWNGHVKASVDPLKMMNGYRVGLEIGALTRDRMCRETSGMKFSRVARKLRKENQLLAEALEPLQALEQPAQAAPSNGQSPPDDMRASDDEDMSEDTEDDV